MEEHSQSVVLEGAEAVTAPLHLLHAEVEALGRPVRGAGAMVLVPCRRLPFEPSAQVCGAVALDHVDDDPLVEVDETGGYRVA